VRIREFPDVAPRPRAYHRPVAKRQGLTRRSEDVVVRIYLLVTGAVTQAGTEGAPRARGS